MRRKPKGDVKLPEENTNRVTSLGKLGAEGYSFEGPGTLLQRILTECAVKPSLDLGICGDSRKCPLLGDGALLETDANHFGNKICSCREQSIYHCACPRLYTGPTANWGWDSYHDAGSTDTRCTPFN